MYNNLELFITPTLKNFLKDLYNNNNITNIKISLYTELYLFIEKIKTFNIVNTYNVLKNNIINIICSSNTLEIKNKKLNDYILSLNYSIDSNDIISKTLLEIKKNFSENKYNDNCKSEVMKTINKHFFNKENIKICDDIKNKLKKNTDDSELFFKFFNNIEFDENVFSNNPKILTEITSTSIFDLKKDKNNNILLFELFNSENVKIIITDSEIEKYKKNKEMEKIFSDANNPKITEIAQAILPDFINKYNIKSENNEIKTSTDENNSQVGGGILNGLKNIILWFLKYFFRYRMLCLLYFGSRDIITLITLFNVFNPLHVTLAIFIVLLLILFETTFNFVIIYLIGDLDFYKNIYNKIINLFKSITNKIFNTKKIGGFSENTFSNDNQTGGYSGNKYFIIKNLKQHISNLLLSININNEEIIPINKIEIFTDTLNSENDLYTIDYGYHTDCLEKTNLFKINKPNREISKIWGNGYKSINSPNILLSPNNLQILKDSSVPNNLNYQLGGNVESNKNFTETVTKDIKIQYSFHIVNLLKKALLNLNNNNIYLDEKTIDDIKNKINIIEKSEIELSEYSKNIVDSIKISSNLKNKDNLVLNTTELNNYVNKNKLLLNNSNKIVEKLNIALLKILEML